MAISIDLNCDMGEFQSLTDAELDIAIMPLISRCNIAVGGHAGTSETIHYCFVKAAEHNLAIGIHPSYADRERFGRQILQQSWSVTDASLREQIELGLSIADKSGVTLSHVKFHGALYNQVEADQELAHNVCQIMADYPELAILGMANGLLYTACSEIGISFIHEAFIDRRYMNTTQLQPRSEPGSVYSSTEEVIRQALAIAMGTPVYSNSGEKLVISADSLCIHSDTPDALTLLKALRHRLEEASIEVI